MRTTVAGPFSARPLGVDAWHLNSAAPASPEVYLRGASHEASDLLRKAGIANLSLEWHENGVMMTWPGLDGSHRLTAASAIVHEATPHLYDGLPLASFDAAARSFWNRVFSLMRLPGGRLLLKFIARRGPRGARGPRGH